MGFNGTSSLYCNCDQVEATTENLTMLIIGGGTLYHVARCPDLMARSTFTGTYLEKIKPHIFFLVNNSLCLFLFQ